MNVLRRAWRSAAGRRGKTFIQMALTFLCTLLLLFAAYITSLTNQYKNTLLQLDGACITVETDAETYATLRDLDWADIPHVEQADRTAGYAGILAGKDGSWQSDSIGMEYHGDLLNWMPSLSLLDGDLPWDGTFQILISQVIAAQYGLNVGDSVLLSDLEEIHTCSVTISGIFLSGEEDDRADPAFCTSDVVDALGVSSYQINLYPDSVAHLNQIEIAAQNLVDASGVRGNVINSLTADAGSFSGVAEMLLNISNGLLWGTLLLAFWILALVSLLWTLGHSRDMGIYLALGQTKPRIAGQCILEAALVGGVASVLGGVVGFFVLNLTGGFLVLKLRSLFGYGYFNELQEMDTQLLQSRLPPQAVLWTCLLIVGMMVLLTALYSTILLRARWRILFEHQS